MHCVTFAVGVLWLLLCIISGDIEIKTCPVFLTPLESYTSFTFSLMKFPLRQVTDGWGTLIYA